MDTSDRFIQFITVCLLVATGITFTFKIVELRERIEALEAVHPTITSEAKP